MAKKGSKKPTRADLKKAGPGARFANRIPLKILEKRLARLQKIVKDRKGS